MFSWKSFEILGKPSTPFAWNCCSWNSVLFSPFLCHSCLLWGHREHWEARAAALWSEGHSTGKAGIQHVPFCPRETCTKSPENWKGDRGDHVFFSVWATLVVLPPAPAALPGEGAEVPLYLLTVVRRGSAVTCVQSHLQTGCTAGEHKCVFFKTLSRFIVWFPVRSLHFPSPPLPAADTLFLTFCVALCSFRHQCARFLHSWCSLNF